MTILHRHTTCSPSVRPARSGVPAVGLLAAALAAAQPCPAAEPAALPGFNVDPNRITVSGISSGAFMAVQIAVAHSATVEGVGAIAGGPWGCAEGSATKAIGPCMVGVPDGRALAKAARQAGAAGRIDPVEHLARQKVWLFNGYNDGVVKRPVSDALRDFYRSFTGDANLFYKNNLSAAHSQVTLAYGQDCSTNGGDFMNNCRYDAAGSILQHLYGTLAPRAGGKLGGTLLKFSQAEFLSVAPARAGMAGEGFAYVPARCAQGQPCRLHIALHGCKQYAGLIGDRYYAHAGYNEWADGNDLVILYPQTVATLPGPFNPIDPINPNGCWDWWGYVNADYAVKDSVQIRAIRAMVERIGSKYTTGLPAAAGQAARPAARQLSAHDTTAVSVALAWPAAPGPVSVNVYRADCPDCTFTRVSTTPAAGGSFGDHGLRPQTRYLYKIRVLGDGGVEGPDSAPASVTTAAEQPSCDPYQRDNYSHWMEGRADVGLFGLTAKGSRQPMGLALPTVETTLRRTAADHYEIGACP